MDKILTAGAGAGAGNGAGAGAGAGGKLNSEWNDGAGCG